MNRRSSILRSGLILLLAAALTLCAGCRKGAVSSIASSASAPASSAAEETPQAEPLTQLTCLSSTTVPQVNELANGMLLACWTEYDESDAYGDINSSSTSYLVLIDREEDKIVSTVVADLDYTLVQSFSDSSALLLYYDSDGSHYALCTSNLEIIDLVLPSNAGCFSSDGRLFYYISGEILYCYDISRQVSEPVELEYNLRFNYLDNIYTNDTLLSCSIYCSNYSNDSCIAVINLQTGKLVLMQDTYMSYHFNSTSIFSINCDYSEELFQIDRIPLDGGTMTSLSKSMPNDEMNFYFGLETISGSDYLYSSYDSAIDGGEGEDYNPESDAAVTKIMLFRFAEDGFESCSLTDFGISGMAYYAAGLSDGTILFSTYQDDGSAVLYIVNPEVLTYESLPLAETGTSAAIDQDLLDAYLSELNSPELSGNLSGVRAQADELESKYDVQILLSNACETPCSYSGYEVVTSDQAGWANEAATIARALTQLEEVLSLYPEDFFSQFRTEAETSGVCFLLTGPITNENGPANVVAFEYNVSNRYFVCADLTYYQLEANFHHELWHAIEAKLSSANVDIDYFYSDKWSACNPADFSYTYGFEDYDAGVDFGKWTTYGSEDVYFVDDYSRTFPGEDRGRIWENAMESDGSAQFIAEYDHLMEKLRLMNSAIRAGFDTSDWDSPRWETYA